MPSPDFSELISVTAVELQPSEIYDAAVDYARIAFPEFEPRAGTVEDALLQAFSLVSSYYVAAANRIPDGTIEGVLRLYGLERREDGFCTTTATVTILTPGGTIEAGTQFIYVFESIDGIEQYGFELLSSATASAGSTTLEIDLRAVSPGIIPSAVVGTPLIIAQPTSEILSAITSGPLVQGTTGETYEEFLQRGVTYLASLSTSLATAKQVESYILAKYPSVVRCKVFDLAFGPSVLTAVDATVTIDTSGTPNVVLTIPVPTTDDFELFLENLPTPITADYGSLWITTPASRYSPTFDQTTLPSGLIEQPNWTWAAGDGEMDVTITPDTVTTETESGPIVVQIVEDISWTQINLANSLKDKDARGCFVIFLYGDQDAPVPVIDRISIMNDLDARLPAGISRFLFDVMPVDIFAEIQIEVADGFIPSTVLQEVEATVNDYFTPTNYPEWTQFIYKNEVVSVVSRINGVKRVVEVEMTVPTYGEGPVTSTTGSAYYNNDVMCLATVPSGADVAPKLEFTYAGSMPRFTSSVTTESII